MLTAYEKVQVKFRGIYQPEAETGLDIKKMKGIIKDGITVLSYRTA